MNIILFTGRRGQLLNAEFKPFQLILAATLALTPLIGALLAGASTDTGRRDTVAGPELADWQRMIREQRGGVARVRHAAQADLDALTLRIGGMQARMLRLNALGKRLVEKAGLDGEEFDFDAEPGVGGPQTHDDPPVRVPDFLAMLDSLAAELEDRERKLSVLDTLLMNSSVHERVMPSGRPVDEGWLSSGFGRRSDPFTGKQQQHMGQDFAGKSGSPVIAVGDGVVSWAGKRAGYGRLLEINHGNGYTSRYGHNRQHLVKEGDRVRKGQRIALMGSSGRSTGPHVHFEVLHNGKQVNPAEFTTR
jgi:murein DD-endopeptidase MepM/ murein hydrolase activator NlpD